MPWWLALCGCLLLALLAYLPGALFASFVNFDDNLFFGPDNPLFAAAADRARDGGVLAGLLTVLDPRQVVADVYLPVAHGSLWLDYWWFSGTPFGPHLVSLLLHGLAGFCLWRWLEAMRLPRGLSFGAAAVFLLHPALCESVAWVSSRKDVLSGLFVFLAMGLVARLAELRPGWRPVLWRLVAIAVCGTLAMYSKATAVVQPLLAALVCLYMSGDRRRWLGPLVLALVTAPIAWHHRQLAAAAGTMLAGEPLQRLPQVPGALVHYGGTAMWPANLNVLYPEVQTLERFAANWVPALAVVVAAGLLALWCWRRPRLRLIGFGVLGFGAALLPFNTAWPASVIAVADRYLYLALPFLVLAVIRLVVVFTPRPGLIAGVLAVPLLVATWDRVPAFADSQRLWQQSLLADADNAVALLNLIAAKSPVATDVEWARPLAERAAAVARYPEHERRAQLLLAQYALAENRFEAAVLAMERAIDASREIADSGRVDVDTGRALQANTLVAAIPAFRQAGRSGDAQALLERARELVPDDPGVVSAAVLLALDDLAQDLRESGGTAVRDDDPRVQAVERQLEQVRSNGVDDAQIEYAAGTFARLRGRRLLAIKCYRRALQQQPQFVEAWLGCAEVCLEAVLCAEAEDYARSGIAAAVGAGRAADPRLRLALARALKGQGRIDEAIESLAVYVRQTPRDRDAARLLSGLLMHKARTRLSDPQVTHAELQRLIERALAVNPQEPAVDLVRARMLRDRRQFAAAVEALDRLAVTMPELEDTPTMLADCLRDLGYECLFRKDDDGAVAAWLRFLRVAPPGIDTEPVRLQLGAIWRRKEAEGIAARERGDRAGATAAFRQCLLIDPDQHWAAWLLVSMLFDDPTSSVEEMLDLSEKALRWQREHGLDRSQQVTVRAFVLQRAGRVEEARQLVADYLEAPDDAAGIEVLALLRGLRDDLGR